MAQGQKSVTLHPDVIEKIKADAKRIRQSFSSTLNAALMKYYKVGYGSSILDVTFSPAIDPKEDLKEIKRLKKEYRDEAKLDLSFAIKQHEKKKK